MQVLAEISCYGSTLPSRVLARDVSGQANMAATSHSDCGALEIQLEELNFLFCFILINLNLGINSHMWLIELSFWTLCHRFQIPKNQTKRYKFSTTTQQWAHPTGPLRNLEKFRVRVHALEMQ
jgi:hypothetical protein